MLAFSVSLLSFNNKKSDLQKSAESVIKKLNFNASEDLWMWKYEDSMQVFLAIREEARFLELNCIESQRKQRMDALKSKGQEAYVELIKEQESTFD